LAIVIVDAVVSISSVMTSGAGTLIVRCDDKEYVLAQMGPQDVKSLNQQRLKLDIFEHVELMCKGSSMLVSGSLQGDARLVQPSKRKQEKIGKETGGKKPVVTQNEEKPKPAVTENEERPKTKPTASKNEEKPKPKPLGTKNEENPKPKQVATENEEKPKTEEPSKKRRRESESDQNKASSENEPPKKQVARENAGSKKQVEKENDASKKQVAKENDEPKKQVAKENDASKKQVAKENNEPKKEPVKRKTIGLGVQVEILKPGQGQMAKLGNRVIVSYEGRLASNGKRFDKGKIPFRLGMGEVIRGWDEGVKGMLVGECRKLLIPAHAAYGARGAPPSIPPNASLMFDVELLKVQ